MLQFFPNKKNKQLYFITSLILFLFFSNSGCYEGHGLEPEPPEGEIRGKVEFTGEWPDSTKEVRIVVLKEYPYGIDNSDLMNFVVNNIVKYSNPVPENSLFYNYRLQVPPGEYGWVLVAWFPDIPSYFLEVKELGAYYNDPEQEYPSSVSVNAGETVKGIDIRADFSNVDNEYPFFKKSESTVYCYEQTTHK